MTNPLWPIDTALPFGMRQVWPGDQSSGLHMIGAFKGYCIGSKKNIIALYLVLSQKAISLEYSVFLIPLFI